MTGLIHLGPVVTEMSIDTNKNTKINKLDIKKFGYKISRLTQIKFAALIYRGD
jgi:hypothetical protein